MTRYFIPLVIVLFLNYGCAKREVNESIVCEKLQMMSEKCEGEILSLFRNFIKENEEGGRSDFDFVLIESRIKKKISQKQGQTQCERYRKSANKEERSRFNRLKDCTRTESCREFAGCIITF